VTPLVDVMLVLLIIFMVTTPMMQEGIDVELPKVEAGALPEILKLWWRPPPKPISWAWWIPSLPWPYKKKPVFPNNQSC